MIPRSFNPALLVRNSSYGNMSNIDPDSHYHEPRTCDWINAVGVGGVVRDDEHVISIIFSNLHSTYLKLSLETRFNFFVT